VCVEGIGVGADPANLEGPVVVHLGDYVELVAFCLITEACRGDFRSITWYLSLHQGFTLIVMKIENWAIRVPPHP